MYPHERSLVEELAGKPFVLLGVNSDPSPEKVADVMEKENITWDSFFDGGTTTGPIATKWGIFGWPTMYLIDHKGIIRWVGYGSGFEELLKELIADVPPWTGRRENCRSVEDGRR